MLRDISRSSERSADLMCWTGYLTCAGCRGLTVALEKSYCWLESADLTWKSADLMVGNMVPQPDLERIVHVSVSPGVLYKCCDYKTYISLTKTPN